MFADEEPHEVLLGVVVGSAAPDFDEFYATSARRSLAVAVALTGNWADAEELVQEAYAAAYRDWARVGAYDNPSAWVARVLTNRSASRWRRRGREVRAVARLRARPVAVVDEAGGDPAFWAAVQHLPDRQREVVALFYVADRSVAEIAVQIGCSEGTVKPHLSRARLALHETLIDDQEDPR